MGVEMVAYDGARCFGFSVDANGRAVCQMTGAKCPCRSHQSFQKAEAILEDAREAEASARADAAEFDRDYWEDR